MTTGTTSRSSTFGGALAAMRLVNPEHFHTVDGLLTRQQAAGITEVLSIHRLLRNADEARDLIHSVDWDCPLGQVEPRELVTVLEHAGALK